MQHSLQALRVEMRARSCRFSAGERWSRRAPVASPADAPLPSSSPPSSCSSSSRRARRHGGRPCTARSRAGSTPGRSPFEGGRHRGVDLAAPPGQRGPRAVLAGGVVVAGRVGTSGARRHAAVRPLARDPHAAGRDRPFAVGAVAGRGAAVGTVGAVACARGPAPRRPPRRRAVRLRRPAALPRRSKRPDAPTLVGRRAAPARGPEVARCRGLRGPRPVASAGAAGFESGPRRRSRAVARLGRARACARRCGRTVAGRVRTRRGRCRPACAGGSLKA